MSEKEPVVHSNVHNRVDEDITEQVKALQAFSKVMRYTLNPLTVSAALAGFVLWLTTR